MSGQSHVLDNTMSISPGSAAVPPPRVFAGGASGSGTAPAISGIAFLALITPSWRYLRLLVALFTPSWRYLCLLDFRILFSNGILVLK